MFEEEAYPIPLFLSFRFGFPL